MKRAMPAPELIARGFRVPQRTLVEVVVPGLEYELPDGRCYMRTETGRRWTVGWVGAYQRTQRKASL